MFGLGFLLVGAGTFLFFLRGMRETKNVSRDIVTTEEHVILEEKEEKPVPLAQQGEERGDDILIVDISTVPFTSQAPSGEWKNPLFQNGCEEASVLIASHFEHQETISNKKAQEEILRLLKLSMKMFGTSVDTSAKDTLKLFQAYTGRNDGILLDEVTGDILRARLARGEILIVPMNGQLLGNPHFTYPGPVTHMLVLLGYDAKTKEYITHDPGTRFGARYRYPLERFENAIRDYPTGDHLPSVSVEKRAIVIGRQR